MDNYSHVSNNNNILTNKCDTKVDCTDDSIIRPTARTTSCMAQVAPPRKRNLCKKLSMEEGEALQSMDENEEWAKVNNII